MIFGKKLDPAKKGIVKNLNEISDELLAELRSVGSEVAAQHMLLHYTDLSNSRHVLGFVLNVVYGRQ